MANTWITALTAARNIKPGDVTSDGQVIESAERIENDLVLLTTTLGYTLEPQDVDALLPIRRVV